MSRSWTIWKPLALCGALSTGVFALLWQGAEQRSERQARTIIDLRMKLHGGDDKETRRGTVEVASAAILWGTWGLFLRPTGLSGIWTAGRKLLIELSLREKVGEYFGLYGITTKLSVIGSAVVGVLQDVVSKQTGSDLTGWKVAIGAQAGPLLLGILFLALVKKPQPGPASATS